MINKYIAILLLAFSGSLFAGDAWHCYPHDWPYNWPVISMELIGAGKAVVRVRGNVSGKVTNTEKAIVIARKSTLRFFYEVESGKEREVLLYTTTGGAFWWEHDYDNGTLTDITMMSCKLVPE